MICTANAIESIHATPGRTVNGAEQAAWAAIEPGLLSAWATAMRMPVGHVLLS